MKGDGGSKSCLSCGDTKPSEVACDSCQVS